MNQNFFTIMFIVMVICLAALPLMKDHSRRRKGRDAWLRTDTFLTRAEREMMLKNYDASDALFNSALIYAPASGCGLFQAEAYYGIARLRERQGKLEASRDALQLALSNRDTWADEKPNFEKLIKAMLADINRQLSK